MFFRRIIPLLLLLGSFSLMGAPGRVWLGDDFFVEQTEELLPQSNRVSDCKAHIRQILCWVEPDAPGTGLGSPRPCLAGGEKYAPHFETLYEEYPKPLQKMFCSLDQIFIETKSVGTAYAGYWTDPKGNSRTVMGIRQEFLDNPLSLTVWASWKEQLSFGGDAGHLALNPGLPGVSTHSSGTRNDFLYFVVAHEFGHLFDFKNKLNRYQDPIGCAKKHAVDPDAECEMDPQSWGGISWVTDRRPKPQNNFPHLKDLCFYWCEGKFISPPSVPALYRDLDRSEFVSIYATTQPWDDWADSVAYFTMKENLHSHYELLDGQGASFDVLEKVESLRFQRKHQFLERFFSRSPIQYP